MKSIIKFWEGKKMCEVYPHAKWYQVQLFYAKRAIRRTLIVTGLIVTVAWTYAGAIIYGQYSNPQVIYAKEVVEVLVTSDELPPVLKRIIKCESGGKHYDKNGQVLMRANNNKTIDIGIAQINEFYWGKKATELGLNLVVEKDNIAMAKWLYANHGTEPWVWTKPCWNK